MKNIKSFNEFLNESLNESKIYNIVDLSDFFNRMGYDSESVKILSKLLTREFKRDGDKGVIEIFKEITGQDIYAISRGRYVFDKLN